MAVVGKVESLWRYPVKSMRGEELDAAFMGFSGVYGDRVFAFTSSASHQGFPFFTGREKSEMLRYRPRFRDEAAARQPVNLAEAAGLGPGITPVYGNLDVEVETPSGDVLAIDDPTLVAELTAGLGDEHVLTLLRSERALTDCRPVSLFSLQTAGQIGKQSHADVDKRRFRANIYVDLTSGEGYGEDGLIGRSVRIGSKVVLSILERDPRCKMITLDPDTAESNGDVLRTVAKEHSGMAGIYAAVLVEGMVENGDEVDVLS